MLDSVVEVAADALPIALVAKGAWETWLESRPAPERAWLEGSGFKPDAGKAALLPGADGAPAAAVAVVGEAPDLWDFAAVAEALPARAWRLGDAHGFTLDAAGNTAAALGWMLAAYRFSRYRDRLDPAPVLLAPETADLVHARRLAAAVGLVRDLVNTPANDLGPAELEAAAATVAEAGGAAFRTISGEALAEGYPMIHAVGRGSDRAPRLIDFTWGAADAPKLTLVGKGVCFDSGGLDLKSADGMRLMKKDMGGAAHVLALAQAIMDEGLPVRLRVLVPAVENAVSGSAFRPGDIVATRAGKTVEIGNTDAEGRLVLADALAEADSEAPDLVIDVATLTGAARVALGTDVGALFSDDDSVAEDLHAAAAAESDPLWRLPLWKPYREQLSSDVADINNISDGPYGGAVTAALFLQEFLEKSSAWTHLDIMAWNRTHRPGRPKGGEAIALRAFYAMIRNRYPRTGTL
jgi:leucyl aminopeptidase